MNKYRDQLEGSGQLFRIRRLRRIVALALVVLGILVAVASMAIEGASLKPLFLPVDGVVAIAVILLFLATVAGLAFRSLEIRYAKRDSQRFLLARTSIRRAWTILFVGAILGIVLLLPATGGAINSALTDVRVVDIPGNGKASLSFPSADTFALTQYKGGRLDTGGSPISVHVYSNGVQLSRGSGQTYSFSTIPSPGQVEYNVTIDNLGAQPVRVEVTLERIAMPALTGVVPAVLLAFAVVEGFWIAYARPLHAKYEASSIYSLHYAEAAGSGEQTFAEYYRATPRPERAALAESAPPTRATGPVPIVPALAEWPLPPPPSPPSQPMPSPQFPPPPPPIAGPPPAPGPPPEPTSADLLDQGSKLFSEGKLEPALALFDEVLEREPTNVQALLAGAAALVRLGRGDEARGQYDEVIRLDPRNAKALAGRAQLLDSEGRWAQAADAWGAYLQVVPPDLDARQSRAEALLRTGDRGGAVRELEQALFLSPSDARIRQRLAGLRINVPQLLSKALIASASGQYDEALVDYTLILAVDPDNVNALVGKGVALRRAGQADEALKAFDLALAKQPGNSAALRAKGAILEEKLAFAGALDVYDDLLAWNPRDPEVWALQGTVLERLGEPEEALASYMEALKLEPSNPEWRKRADALEASRKGQEAFLEELFAIEGVGPSRARALLAAGYKTADALRKATEDEIANVKGMTRAIARDIYRHFHAEPPPPPPERPRPVG